MYKEVFRPWGVTLSESVYHPSSHERESREDLTNEKGIYPRTIVERLFEGI
jgi:hypothetical protein